MKCLKFRDFGVMDSHGRHLLDVYCLYIVYYICSIDPLHLLRTPVLGVAISEGDQCKGPWQVLPALAEIKQQYGTGTNGACWKGTELSRAC